MSLSNLPKVIQASTSKVIFFNYPRYPNTCPHIVNELIKLILVKYKELSGSHSVVSSSLQPHGLYSPWNSPDQNTGVGSLSFLQGIFPTQVSCIAGGFFTSWATREAHKDLKVISKYALHVVRIHNSLLYWKAYLELEKKPSSNHRFATVVNGRHWGKLLNIVSQVFSISVTKVIISVSHFEHKMT